MSIRTRGVRRGLRGRTSQRPCRQMVLERLEGRFLPSTTFTQTNLESDVPGQRSTAVDEISAAQTVLACFAQRWCWLAA